MQLLLLIDTDFSQQNLLVDSLIFYIPLRHPNFTIVKQHISSFQGDNSLKQS